jgi:ABC-type multidrug transport system fused ATPase/permease subunit
MKKTTDLTAFKRIWAYVWPQWPRLVAVMFWSGLMACMLSVSIVTMIPVLKVMMGEEGLHGWVDRKICDQRFGMDFYLPDKTDLYNEADTMKRQLIIVHIKKDSWAQQAGLQLYDRVLGVSKQPEGPEITTAMEMQEILATCDPGQSLKITFGREGQDASVVQAAPVKPLYADAAQWVVGHVPRNETNEKKFKAIMVLVIAMTVVTILRCLARFYQSYLGEKIVQIAVTRIREDVFRHVMYMSVGFFAARGTSDTTSRIVGDVAVSGKGIKVLLGKAIREPFSAAAALAVAFKMNWQLTAIFISSAPAVLFLFAYLGKKMKRATKKSLVVTAHILGRIQEAMNALRVVKVYNRQEYEIDHYQQANQALLKQNLKISKVEVGTNPLLDVLGMIAMAGAILMGAAWVSGEYPRLQSSEFFILIGGTLPSRPTRPPSASLR